MRKSLTPVSLSSGTGVSIETAHRCVSLKRLPKIAAIFLGSFNAPFAKPWKPVDFRLARGLQFIELAAARVPAFLTFGGCWSESRNLIGEQRSGTRRDKSPGDGRNARIGIAPPKHANPPTWNALKRSGGLTT